MFRRGGICLLGYQFCPFLRFVYWIVVEMFPVWTCPPQSIRKIVERVNIDTLTNKYHPVWTFPPQSNRKVVEKVKIDSLANKYLLTLSMIFLLDCGGNVQTRWYLFVRVSILLFSTIFLLDCGGNVQTGNKYPPVWTFPPQSNGKIVENVKIDTLTNKYHPVWTFPPQSNRKILEKVKIDTLTNIGLWWKCSDGVVFVC
jgi:ribosomal protein L31